jgi:transcriptional regulator with XRE-family HTH domain
MEGLEDLRERCGLNRSLVAQKVGVSASYIGRLERGEKKPGFSTAMRLARLYRVDVNVVARATGVPVTREQADGV